MIETRLKYVDTHVHLTLDHFKPDLEEIIMRAKNAGVERMIVIGTDLASSRDSIKIAEQHEGIWASVGIHPHEAAKTGTADLAEIEHLAGHPKVVAVGEIGLDYYYDFAPADLQQDLFKIQLLMARRLNHPVIVHVREAMEDALRVIDRSGCNPWSGVFHCFGGKTEDIPVVLDRGFHISFTGVVTFKNYKQYTTVKSIPLGRLLLETDAPYMTPEPYRGKRNEPMYLPVTASRIAEMTGIPLKTLADTTTSNAVALFGLEN